MSRKSTPEKQSSPLSHHKSDVHEHQVSYQRKGESDTSRSHTSSSSVSGASFDVISMFKDQGKKFSDISNGITLNGMIDTTTNKEGNVKKSGSIRIKKRFGKMEEFNPIKIHQRLNLIILYGIYNGVNKSDQTSDLLADYEPGYISYTNVHDINNLKLNLSPSELIKNIISSVKDGMTSEEIDKLTINLALSKIQEQPEWDIFAGRLFTSNEEKKLRNFNWIERCKMMYHGTWPYMFEEFDVKAELGSAFKGEVDHDKQVIGGSPDRMEALKDIIDMSVMLEKFYANGSETKGTYTREKDGPYLSNLNIRSDCGMNGLCLPIQNWDFLSFTDSSYMNNTEYQNLFVNRRSNMVSRLSSSSNIKTTYDKRDDAISNLIVDRHELIHKTGGYLNYENIISSLSFCFDSKARIVSLHSILHYDFYRLLELKGKELQDLVDHVRADLHRTMNHANSTYQATLGKFSYCLKTPLTKRYMELPHESVVRCACNSVIASYYENPMYARHKKDGSVFDFKKSYIDSESADPESSYSKGIDPETSAKIYVDYDLFDVHEWSYFMSKVCQYIIILINNFITLPTPTQKNTGTRNSQGTSCFLLHTMDDSIKGIYRTLEKKELCSKIGGGTSWKMGLLRGSDSVIKKTNGKCSGTLPITRLQSTSTEYVDQAGGRDGANSTQYDFYHKDFLEVIQHKDTKQKELDMKVSAKKIFYAVLLNDLFIKRWEEGSYISLFCPADVPLLDCATDPETFEKIYCSYEKLGLAKNRIDARLYLIEIASVALSAGDPYILSLDNVNKLSMQVPRNNNGDLLTYKDMFDKESPHYDEKYAEEYNRYMNIRSFNLCTEVAEPISGSRAGGKIPARDATCNLAAINTMKACVDRPDPNIIRCEGFRMIKNYLWMDIEMNIRKLFFVSYSTNKNKSSSDSIDEEVAKRVGIFLDTFKQDVNTMFHYLETVDYTLTPNILRQQTDHEKDTNGPNIKRCNMKIPTTKEVITYWDNIYYKRRQSIEIIHKFQYVNQKCTSHEPQMIKDHVNNKEVDWFRAVIHYLCMFEIIMYRYVSQKLKTLVMKQKEEIIYKKNGNKNMNAPTNKRNVDTADHSDTSKNTNSKDRHHPGTVQNICDVDNIVDFSVLFACGWYGLTLADSFIGLTNNLPRFLQIYNGEYRSVIVGPSGIADVRIRCGISWNDLEKSLKLERDIAESIQFGTLLASSFLAIVVNKAAYARFNEGAMSKGFFHHELFGKYFGDKVPVIPSQHLSETKNMSEEETRVAFYLSDMLNENVSNNGTDGNSKVNGREIKRNREHISVSSSKKTHVDSHFFSTYSAVLGDILDKNDNYYYSSNGIIEDYITNNAHGEELTDDQNYDDNDDTNNSTYRMKDHTQHHVPLKSKVKVDLKTDDNDNDDINKNVYHINKARPNLYIYKFKDTDKYSVLDNKKRTKKRYRTQDAYSLSESNEVLESSSSSLYSSEEEDNMNLSIESGMWAFAYARGVLMAYGLFNSTGTGAMPTSNSSIRIGGTQSFQPIQGIYIVRYGKLGTTVETSWTSIEYLMKNGYWNKNVQEYIATNEGSIKGAPGIPKSCQSILLTAFEIKPETLILHDVVRQAFTCQSQSSNRYLPITHISPEIYSELLYDAYKRGLCTLSYYTSVATVVKGNTASSLAKNHVDKKQTRVRYGGKSAENATKDESNETKKDQKGNEHAYGNNSESFRNATREELKPQSNRAPTHKRSKFGLQDMMNTNKYDESSNAKRALSTEINPSDIKPSDRFMMEQEKQRESNIFISKSTSTRQNDINELKDIYSITSDDKLRFNIDDSYKKTYNQNNVNRDPCRSGSCHS